MTVLIQRLSSHLFPVLFKTGERINTPSLLCLVSRSEHASSQYAVIVSVKVQKSAVKRNRIKRIIRAALNHTLPHRRSPICCLIVVKKDCSMKYCKDMMKELEVLRSL